MRFGKFTRRDTGLVSVRQMRSASNTVLESGSQEQAPEDPTPIKSFTNGTARSRHLEHGAHLHRYWIRGIIGIFVPLAISIYWLIVWYVYLAPQPVDSPVLYGHSGGRWIFYSWFLIGIFGMNLSKYGLTGVEAGMLMDPRWAAKNTMQIMMHAEHSWSGPSGWMKSLKHMFVRGDKRPEPPTPLWTILAFLSILPIVAIPLTGLCYELKDGFHPTGNHPNVTGLDWSNINSLAGAKLAGGIWKSGNNASLPGLGVIYTSPNVSRSDFPNLSKFPNYLPVDDGVEKVFITQQAEEPISGTSWGLLLSYNCSVVTNPSEFIFLNQRQDGMAILETGENSYYPNDTGINNAYVYIRNDSSEFIGTYAPNYFAALEEGISRWPPVKTEDGIAIGYADPALDNWSNVSDTSYFWNHNTPGQYPAFETKTVYEVALWQDIVTNITKEPLTYDNTLQGNLTNLYGKYYKVLPNEHVRPWSAIGVRCMSSSEVGTAKINGPASTYTDFQRTDTPIPDLLTQSPRLEVSAPSGVIDDSMYELKSSEWIPNLFRSINSPVNLIGKATFNETAKALGFNETQIAEILEEAKRTNTTEEVTAAEQVALQTRYLQAEDLRQSLLRTYPAYIDEFLFNGGDDWHDKDGSLRHISNVNPNVTSFVERRLFERGDILQFWIPGALLIIWAAGSIILTLMYGFRRRWSATLDSYSVLRFGADLADRIKNHPEFGVNMGFEECFVLRDLPGQVGDANVGFEPGHITLVKGGKEHVIDKRKMYM